MVTKLDWEYPTRLEFSLLKNSKQERICLWISAGKIQILNFKVSFTTHGRADGQCRYLSRSTTKPTKWRAPSAVSLLSDPNYYTMKFEPPHDKPTMWLCAQRRLRSAWASAVRSVGSLEPKLSSCGQRRLWSDWADAQADLSSLGAQSFCWFCYEAAHLWIDF